MATFVSNSEDFPVPTLLHDRTVNFRGGVPFQLRRLHATLEEGGTRFEAIKRFIKRRGELRQPAGAISDRRST